MKRSRSPVVERCRHEDSLPSPVPKRQKTDSGALASSLDVFDLRTRALQPLGSDGSSRTAENSSAIPALTAGGNTWPGRSMPWLRSGRTFAHRLVPESATIQARPLSEFELTTLPDADQTDGAASSGGTTISEAWDSSSPARSFSSTRSLSSTGTLMDLEGYNSDAVTVIVTPTKAGAATPASTPRPAPASAASSPGFELLVDTSLRSARDEWQPERWPLEVMFLTSQYNPQDLKFPPVSSGINGGEGCGCEDRCLASTCVNAQSNRFCNAVNCPFMGVCGNSLRESSVLAICRNVRTGMRGVVAVGAIPAGEVIGEYFGRLQHFGAPRKNGPANDGYRLGLKTKTTGNKYVGIDALHAGGKLRLLNHSCNPCARFHEVRTGKELTVVAVTIRDVFPGEEVTRGRRSGYKNFSLPEQFLLCEILEDIRPLGKDMWERAAEQYNYRRPRGTCERDYESLRRKFRNLVGKNKPTGINGEIPESKRPIAMAQEIHALIEADAGSNETLDGLDDGEQDSDLLRHVDSLQGRSPSARRSLNEGEDLLTAEDRSHQATGGDTASHLESNANRHGSTGGETVSDGASVATGLRSETAAEPGAQSLVEEEPTALGTIATREGSVSVVFSQDLEGWDSDGGEEKAEEGCQIEGPEVGDPSRGRSCYSPVPEALDGCDGDGTRRETNSSQELTTVLPSRERNGSVSADSEGRRSDLSADRRTFRRNPLNATYDNNEREKHRGLSPASNRLGGQDLRILRDNFHEMGGRSVGSKHKRTASDPTPPATFVAAKRNNAKKRMDDLGKQVATHEDHLACAQDMSTLMIIFREDANRREDAEERRRRQ
ncbi:hypothetical protein F441_11399 [Phytophthora nicotianae CJ01A1]|uniref:SET domain-containing protein n=2 Tax=Phytophthora nicotianae TaxID=4792 RepID=W2WV48_PHYNI|nr:hypothetical protein L916_11066 [Phytophthora nicotianae]ETP13459.1 hypothetical protein F441_11399 [Phytophthora nicotianae CJ01A1]